MRGCKLKGGLQVEAIALIVQDKAMYDFLTQPVTRISGVGAALEKRLVGRGVRSLGDLLLHLPKDYIDDRHTVPVGALHEGESARIIGRIVSKQARGFGRNRQVVIRLADDSGQISLNFFHSGYMMSDARLSEGREISVRGVVERWKGFWQMSHPEWCVTESFNPGFQPVYASLAGLGGRRLGSIIRQIISLMPGSMRSPLDALLKDEFHLPSLSEALKVIHHPDDLGRESFTQAAVRLKSEEIILYLHLMRQKREAAVSAAVALSDDRQSRGLQAAFPFPLTDAQCMAWSDIAKDLESGQRMHRLLQGDVGAGKTWIAALAMARAAGNGGQAALLAPTEVLASQHAETLNALLQPLGFDVALLTGSTRAKARREILARLHSGGLQLIVGTHALLSEDVLFNQLVLALVDEQHRFGVKQRWALAEKQREGGGAVHLLGMTATPIPRSLALALYGDMDLSIMRGMPPGRLAIETRVIAADKMAPLVAGMQRILDAGGRIYWIVPRIDEDEDGVSVDQRVELLQGYFPDANVIGLHGRMKSKDKQSALDAFSSGACKIVVSTTVVEVGVNVPEARLIVIEQAENYGLAQLHQLRGRVGRSSEQGYCMLVAGSDTSEASLARLKKMVDTHDGLELAEADLEMRGGGDAIGTRQHGEAGFRVLNMSEDAVLIRQWHEGLPDFMPDELMQRFWRPFAESTD